MLEGDVGGREGGKHIEELESFGKLEGPNGSNSCQK